MNYKAKAEKLREDILKRKKKIDDENKIRGIVKEEISEEKEDLLLKIDELSGRTEKIVKFSEDLKKNKLKKLDELSGIDFNCFEKKGHKHEVIIDEMDAYRKIEKKVAVIESDAGRLASNIIGIGSKIKKTEAGYYELKNFIYEVKNEINEKIDSQVIDHSKLNNLDWSKAGHEMDDNLDMQKNAIINLADPSKPQDAATKNYVDKMVQTAAYAGGGAYTPVIDPDVKVKVSANDTMAGYLNGKLVAGSGITLTENNNGANETLSVICDITQYTDEMAQDAVGGVLVDTATVNFTYDDAGNQITADVIQAAIDYNSISNIPWTRSAGMTVLTNTGDEVEIGAKFAPLGNNGRLNIYNSANSFSPISVVNTKIPTGNTNQYLEFFQVTGAASWGELGFIDIGTEQQWTSTASTQDSYMAFATTLNGVPTERVRIDSAGNVGIGTNAPLFKTDIRGTLGIDAVEVTNANIDVDINRNVLLFGTDNEGGVRLAGTGSPIGVIAGASAFGKAKTWALMSYSATAQNNVQFGYAQSPADYGATVIEFGTYPAANSNANYKANMAFESTFVDINPSKNDIDLKYSGDTTDDIFVIDAGTEQIKIKDDIPLAFGAPDALIDYDSGTNNLDIDLTGGVNTGLRILSDGDGAQPMITIDGANGVMGIASAPWTGASIRIAPTDKQAFEIINTQSTVASLVGLNARTDFAASSDKTSTTGFTNKVVLAGDYQTAPTGGYNEIIFEGTSAGSTTFTLPVKGIQVNIRKQVDSRSFVLNGGTSLIYLSTSSLGGTGTITGNNFYGLYSENFDDHVFTNTYGAYFEEQTGGSNNYEIFLAGGGEIFFRDSGIHIGSLTDGHLDLTADTSIDLNANTFLTSVKSGATQAGAGAATNEIWRTASHATLPDGVLMIGL